MARRRVTLEELNTIDQPAFVAALGFLFEGSPWVAAGAWSQRPFQSLDDLHQAVCAVMYNASVEQQLELIRAHPDLVGRAALAGTLTPESTGEQAAAGLDRLLPEEVALFARLNQEYRAKFGFPFVICARENKKESILNGFALRLSHERDEEIATALDEIAKIARFRLHDAVSCD